MKQTPEFSPLKKALTLVMAALVFALALFFPISRNDQQERFSEGKERLVVTASFHSVPCFPSAAPSALKTLPKWVTIFIAAVPKLWSLVLHLGALEIQEHQAILSLFFPQKINFVFVSTQAP